MNKKTGPHRCPWPCLRARARERVVREYFRVLISELFIEEGDQGDPFTELGRTLSTVVPLSD